MAAAQPTAFSSLRPGRVSGCKPSVAVFLGAILLLAARAGFSQQPFYGNYYLHDPGTLIKNGASYFIYGDGQGISGITTTDLRNWTATGTVFPAAPLNI